jgi:hypothetical protein
LSTEVSIRGRLARVDRAVGARPEGALGDPIRLRILGCSRLRDPPPAPVIYYRLADQRVLAILELAHELLADNADHVAASSPELRVDTAPGARGVTR